ncbi:MAG: hypothetical protein Q4C91_02085 [Eubacteriales bacterium]|nr:hypothetical protein [Eubacteriales bacterium]
MKIIERKIGEFFCEKVIKPIRNKQDAILLLLETLKLVNGNENGITKERGRVIICIDKMNRIFYETDEKIFSLCFPFSLEEKENHYFRIYDNLTDLEITNQMISLLISIFRKDGKLGESLENVMDFIIESAEDYEYQNIDDIWRLLFKLWYMEDGYIRYDYDPEHENNKIHPLHHLDVNYSSGTTYKIGLMDALKIDELRDILDTTTDCLYLAAKNTCC